MTYYFPRGMNEYQCLYWLHSRHINAVLHKHWPHRFVAL